MTLLTALAFAVLLGGAAHLMTRSDLVKLAAGTVLLTNAVVLLLVGAGLGTDRAPILPVEAPSEVADPLVQAFALTAVVIAFGTTVLLLRIALGVERTHGTILLDDLVEAELVEAELVEAAGAEGEAGEPRIAEEEADGADAREAAR